jgi:hypothetical protein
MAHRLGAAVAQAAEDQRVGEPGDAKSDAALGDLLLLLLRCSGKRETSMTLSSMRTASGNAAPVLLVEQSPASVKRLLTSAVQD